MITDGANVPIESSHVQNLDVMIESVCSSSANKSDSCSFLLYTPTTIGHERNKSNRDMCSEPLTFFKILGYRIQQCT